MKALFLSLLLLTGCGQAPSPRVAFYDWEPGRPLPVADQDWLVRSPASVWLKAGHVERAASDHRFVPELSEDGAEAYRGRRVTLCVRFEHGTLAGLPLIEPAELAEETAAFFAQNARTLGSWGVAVEGLQLDLDAPARLLGWYGRYLRALKQALGPGVALSITCLPSWAKHPWDLWRIGRSCDYWVPLFFGDALGPELRRSAPLFRSRKYTAALRALAAHGKPLWIGFPAYHQVQLFDADGALLNARTGLSLAELQGRAELHLVEQGPDGDSGGARLLFRVERRMVLGGRRLERGQQLLWQGMDAAALSEAAQAGRRAAGRVFQGWAIYRLEKHEGAQGMLPEAAAQALRVESMEEAGLLASLRLLPAGPGRWKGKAVLYNGGSFSTDPARGATHLRIRLRDGRFLDADPGQFDGIAWGVGLEGRLAPSSLQRADTLDLQCLGLTPAAGRSSGWIWIQGARPQVFGSAQAPSSRFRGLWEAQTDRQLFPQEDAPQWVTMTAQPDSIEWQAHFGSAQR